MVLVPAMSMHSFRLAGDRPGKMLTINAPAGHELFFGALSAEIQSPEPPADPARLLARARAFDTVFEPPSD